MADDCSILFLPDDIRVTVPAGTTLLIAATEAKVYVNSLCGGDGVCGRCRVIVRSGKAIGGSMEFFTHQDIQRGYMLACQARVESDLEVEIPPETRQGSAPEYVERDVPALADLSRTAGRGRRLSPLVRKHHLHLEPPTLDDNLADLERLELALGKAIRPGGFQMGLSVTRRLPAVLRKADWDITAVTGHRGPLTEIVDVEAGDTTRRNMCIVADIGTTTVVCHLLDLADGQTLGQAAKYNSQAGYGADVIRRIIHAAEGAGNERQLHDAIVSDLTELIAELASRHRLGLGDISLISVAGNTTMIHLLLGLPVDNIRREPYIGAAYRLPPFRAAAVGLQIHPRGLLYSLPCVAGFVGADIVAGIYATSMAQREAVSLLIDIGTNGEIVIGNKDFLVCASASAGPAFEGAECTGGMRATRGAIDHIRLLDADHVLSYSTIASAAPVGICGTGYVDLIAEMLRVGVIDKTGKLQRQASAARVCPGDYEELQYVVVPANQSGGDKDIVITQADVTNLLRAKGAIYAATSVMLHALDMSFDDIAEVMVAGAFGNFLNVENAVLIGMLPDIPLEKLRFVGNTSLAGAKLAALCDDCYDEIVRIAGRITYFELSTEPTFMDQFVAACFLPHTHVELFPSVMDRLSQGGH